MRNLSLSIIEKSLLSFSISLLVMFSGCINWEEEITIDEKGNALMVVRFDGEVEGLERLVALPTAPEWNIIESSHDTTSEGKIKIKLRAEKEILYGAQLPSSFGSEYDAYPSTQMQFPSEVKIWREGKRTYYEFKRSYIGRAYKEYNFFADEEIDRDLEKHIIENGIFNVSAEDREKYVNQLKETIQYSNYKMLFNLLGELVMNNKINLAQRSAILEQGIKIVEEVITSERLIAIFDKEEDMLENEFNRLKQDLYKNFDELFKVNARLDQNLEKYYKQTFNEILNYMQVTENLNSQEFALSVTMPGEIVVTNGMVEVDESNGVLWLFKGIDLHDCNLTVHAVSVVEAE